MGEERTSKLPTASRHRIPYIDALRAWASVAVIAIHVCAQNWYVTDPLSWEWQVLNAFDSAVRWPVPVFIMISGVLFLDGEKQVSIERLYGKTIPRIIALILFWSSAYAGYHLARGDVHSKSELLYRFLAGEYHMWYLYMLVGLYASVPILRRVTSDSVIETYYLKLSFVIACLFPTVLEAYEAACSMGAIPSSWQGGLSALSLVADRLSSGVGLTTGLFYFVLGHHLESKASFGDHLSSASLCGLGLLGVLLTALISSAISISTGTQYGFYSYSSLFVLLTAVALFLLAKRIPWDRVPARVWRLIGCASDRSLLVYLVHPLVLYLTNDLFGINTLSFNPVISVPSLIVIVFLISLAISSLVGSLWGTLANLVSGWRS